MENTVVFMYMMKELRTIINDKLKSITNNVRYRQFPNTADFNRDLWLMFQINNDFNEDSFEKKEVVKNYFLTVFIRHNDLDYIDDLADGSIKSAIYSIQQDYNCNIHLNSYDSDYDYDLNIYESVLDFTISF